MRRRVATRDRLRRRVETHANAHDVHKGENATAHDVVCGRMSFELFLSRREKALAMMIQGVASVANVDLTAVEADPEQPTEQFVAARSLIDMDLSQTPAQLLWREIPRLPNDSFQRALAITHLLRATFDGDGGIAQELQEGFQTAFRPQVSGRDAQLALKQLEIPFGGFSPVPDGGDRLFGIEEVIAELEQQGTDFLRHALR